jgi:tetratricopeptide (TPR) repeat protein
VTLLFSKIFFPIHAIGLRWARARFESHPDAGSAVRLSRALLRIGKVNEAYSAIATGRREFPESPAVNKVYESIRARYAKDLLSSAMRSLKHDKRLENFVRAADLLRTLGEFEKALAILGQVAPAHPNNWRIEFAIAQTFFNRFRALHHPADLTESLKHLRLARDHNPDNLKVLFFLALTCAHARLYREAGRFIDLLLKRAPGDAKALALKTQIKQAAAGPQVRGDVSRLSAFQTSIAQPASGTSETHVELAQRIVEKAAEIPETLGAFVFDGKGGSIAKIVRVSDVFDFSVGDAVIHGMVKSCRADADRIGIGALESCVLTGDGWQVLLRSMDELSVLAFLEGPASCKPLETAIEQLALHTL